jgi:hypothetical protein
MHSNSIRHKYFKARNFIPFLVLASVIINGCGAYPGVMAGNWLITLTPSVSLDQVLATASLRQSGTQITGKVALRGSSTSCSSDASVSGSLEGNSLDLLFVQSQGIAELTGTTNMAFTSGSGVYAISGNSCLQALGPGSWSAVFISN